MANESRIRETTEIPGTHYEDIVIFSNIAKILPIYELTIPWEDNMKENLINTRRELKKSCQDKG